MKLPVIIDPRLYHAVIIDADAVTADYDSAAALISKLSDAGVTTAVTRRTAQRSTLGELFTVCVDGEGPDTTLLLEAARQLDTSPERSVVVATGEAAADAACRAGFSYIVGVDRDSDELTRCGADVVVHGLFEIEVRIGDKRMSQRPNALDSYGQLLGVVTGRHPFVCLDFDGTLSEIVPDPDAATLVDGVAEALKHLAAECPVAIVSGRNVADLKDRVGVPGVYYVGSDGWKCSDPMAVTTRTMRRPVWWLRLPTRPPACAGTWPMCRERTSSTSGSPSRSITAMSPMSGPVT